MSEDTDLEALRLEVRGWLDANAPKTWREDYKHGTHEDFARLQRDWFQTLVKLRLPAAWPFIFNALKINSTLALIGAIVAEFFGTPIVGMGFRISTEVGRMNVDMVWAEIAVAAVAGSAFYGIVALIERAVTFWHPSVRGGQA